MRFIVTGPENGATVRQLERVESLLAIHQEWTDHGNGLCVGVDGQVLELVFNLRPNDIRVRGFPCTITHKQRLDLYTRCDDLELPIPPLQRNTNMVRWAMGDPNAPNALDHVGLLLAVPKEYNEPPPRAGGGTWATVRRARQFRLPVLYIYPGGELYDPRLEAP